jgi:hypothetical protein
MIAANEFRGPVSVDPSHSTSTELLSRSQRPHNLYHSPLEVIVDIEKRDWDFKVQPGMWLHPPLVVDRKAGLVFILPHQIGTSGSGIMSAAFSILRESLSLRPANLN